MEQENIISETSNNNTYSTKQHWNMIFHNDKNIWQCKYCQDKKYSIKTSKTHLKNHSVSCPYSPLFTA